MDQQSFVVRTKEDMEGVCSALKELPLFASLDIVVKEHKLKRTLSQNDLMHKWFDEIAVQKMNYGWKPPIVIRENGKEYKPAELIKEYYKDKFLPTVDIHITCDRIVSKKLSTADLDTGECSRFMQMIDEHCASSGIKLTIPENSKYYKDQ